MKTYEVQLKDTRLFKPVLLDYLQNHEELRPFFGLPPTLESYGQLLEQRNFSGSSRQVLHKSLLEQYKNIKNIPQEQIDALLADNTFTVTTGHQLNIFGGPLFFIYKLVTAINLARQLKATYPEYHFVPVYWMASEDHDFDEINHFYLFGQKWDWHHPEAGNAVGRLSTAGLPELMEQIGEVPEMFRQAYDGTRTLAEATRYFVNELFGHEGLVVLDADDAALKGLFRPVMQQEISQQKAEKSVLAASASLDEMGYKTQVFPRPINLFYLNGQVRERLEQTKEGRYQVLNTSISFSETEIASELEQHPGRFSPNVVMRPVYQETILPNLGYIGGPAEVAYWLQLKGVFDAYQTPFPVVMPRNFALVMNSTAQKKFEKLELQPLDLFKEEHVLKTELVDKNTDINLALDGEIEALERLFEGIMKKAVTVDASLKGFIAGQTKNMVKQMEGVRKKLQKAEEKKQETQIKQLLNLKERLFPDGGPQERSENFLNYYLNDPYFLRDLLQELKPFNFKYYILQL